MMHVRREGGGVTALRALVLGRPRSRHGRARAGAACVRARRVGGKGDARGARGKRRGRHGTLILRRGLCATIARPRFPRSFSRPLIARVVHACAARASRWKDALLGAHMRAKQMQESHPSSPVFPLQAKQAEIQAAQRAIGNVYKLGR